MPIIEEYASKDSVIFTDGFKSYDGLVDYGYKQHYRVNHSANEFSKSGNYINGIKNFWGLCKVRLAKFRGIKNTLHLHIKECKFRYNNRYKNIYKLLLKNFRKKTLKLS